MTGCEYRIDAPDTIATDSEGLEVTSLTPGGLRLDFHSLSRPPRLQAHHASIHLGLCLKSKPDPLVPHTAHPCLHGELRTPHKALLDLGPAHLSALPPVPTPSSPTCRSLSFPTAPPCTLLDCALSSNVFFAAPCLKLLSQLASDWPIPTELPQQLLSASLSVTPHPHRGPSRTLGQPRRHRAHCYMTTWTFLFPTKWLRSQDRKELYLSPRLAQGWARAQALCDSQMNETSSQFPFSGLTVPWFPSPF